MSENLIDGLTKEKIDELKSKFGDVYMVTLGDEKYVYRPIRRFEYKTIMANNESNRAFNEEKIVTMCVVYPVLEATSIPSLKAGTITTLVELIMTASNFGVMEEPVKL